MTPTALSAGKRRAFITRTSSQFGGFPESPPAVGCGRGVWSQDQFPSAGAAALPRGISGFHRGGASSSSGGSWLLSEQHTPPICPLLVVDKPLEGQPGATRLAPSAYRGAQAHAHVTLPKKKGTQTQQRKQPKK
eukprot:RCo018798